VIDAMARRSKVGRAAHPLVVEAEAVILGVIKLVFDGGYEAILDLRPQMEKEIWKNCSRWKEFATVQVEELGSHIFWKDVAGCPIELPADALRHAAEKQEKLRLEAG
jgi:hypothetical protein